MKTDKSKKSVITLAVTEKETSCSLEENKHVLVIGEVATGKTSTYVLPNILEEKEKSLLVFDPRGTRYHFTQGEKQEQGYIVKDYRVLSLDEETIKHIAQMLVKEKTVVYLHFDHREGKEEREETFTSLLNTLYEEIEAQGFYHKGIHVLMDEAQAYKVPHLPLFLVEGRKYNVNFSLTVLHLSSLQHLYGEEATQQMLKYSVKGLFGTRSQEDAEYFASFIEGPFTKEECNAHYLLSLPREVPVWLLPSSH
ncbi:type IV secretory system conjugative DNA transfer family protein [Priestia endophytica]|uniref:type IV secretory system conjugative DNA transfer family protein n=1 Tax=Priestia endophytica TaxID=135735 RepID=UPI002282A392|nr:type IV secretory system conjugative DNA transfer family protein [Priestia endophytica]MCY8234446.1 type IV secretory system conjugative DNA transfer family protein [Priestia endophytica]